MLGFCVVEVQALGPVQLKVVPISELPVKLRVAPAQTGVLLLAEADGTGLIVMVTTVE